MLYHKKNVYRFDYKDYMTYYSAAPTRSAFITARSMVEAVDRFNRKFRKINPDVVNITEIPVPIHTGTKIEE